MRNELTVFLLSLALCGCGVDSRITRREHLASFNGEWKKLAEQELEGKKTLSLADCVDIAMRNNFKVRMANIQVNLAKLGRAISFSEFLPALELSGGISTVNKQLSQRSGTSDEFWAAQDRSIRSYAVEVKMPVFRPTTWFLYSARARKAKSAELMNEYTKQCIAMEVTAQYFQCLNMRELLKASESQLAYSRKLSADVEALNSSGYVENWQAEKSRVYVLDNEVGQARLKRAEDTALSGLLGLMGLSPLSKCELGAGESLSEPRGELADLVTAALLSHLSLYVADQDVLASKEEVKLAVVKFLPEIAGFGKESYSSDSFLKYSNVWSMGISGIMTIFNGFANVNEYRMARAKRKEAWLSREEACLAVILEVIRARSGLLEAKEEVNLAFRKKELAQMRLAVQENRRKEGLSSVAELLDAVAQRDEAVKDHISASFILQVRIAELKQALGQWYNA